MNEHKNLINKTTHSLTDKYSRLKIRYGLPFIFTHIVDFVVIVVVIIIVIVIVIVILSIYGYFSICGNFDFGIDSTVLYGIVQLRSNIVRMSDIFPYV